jgi:hypothetical protein
VGRPCALLDALATAVFFLSLAYVALALFRLRDEAVPTDRKLARNGSLGRLSSSEPAPLTEPRQAEPRRGGDSLAPPWNAGLGPPPGGGCKSSCAERRGGRARFETGDQPGW